MSNEIESVANIVGLGIQTITLVLQSYTAFKKSNIERFFELLLNADQDLRLIGTREDLQRYFFAILDRVAQEANTEKIRHWKNVIVSLATTHSDFEFADNFVSVLDSLTVFDLTVLYKIYNTTENRIFQVSDVAQLLPDTDAEMVKHSVNRLASHNLIADRWFQEVGATYGKGVKEVTNPLYYSKNQLGVSFLRFVVEFPDNK